MSRYKVGLATREKILAATRALLAEAGLDGTTLKAICNRAGVLPGSFYNQFPSKDEAVLQVVRGAIQAVDPHPGDGDDDTLEELVEAYVKFITGDPVVARIYLQIAVGGGLTDERMGARVLRHHRRRMERFTDALLRSRPDLDVAEAQRRVEVTLAALNGLAFQWMLEEGGVDLEGQARRLLGYAFAGDGPGYPAPA